MATTFPSTTTVYVLPLQVPHNRIFLYVPTLICPNPSSNAGICSLDARCMEQSRLHFGTTTVHFPRARREGGVEEGNCDSMAVKALHKTFITGVACKGPLNEYVTRFDWSNEEIGLQHGCFVRVNTAKKRWKSLSIN